MNDLITDIMKWGYDTRITLEASPKDQALKLVSELGELAGSIQNSQLATDDIGDISVVLILLATINNHNPFELFAHEPDRTPEYYDCTWNTHFYDLVMHMGLLCDAVLKNQDLYERIKNCIVTLKSLCEFDNTPLQVCLQMAYNEIKERKGVMYNGVFVKDTDPSYAAIMSELNGESQLQAVLDNLQKD